MSVQIRCAMVLVAVAFVSGCGQKGPLYREAAPMAAPTVDQSETDSQRETAGTPAQQPVQR